MDNNTLFIRTELGNHELQNRSAGFPIKQRQLLFLIDGQNRIADLAAFSPNLEELKLRLVKLMELGLIVEEGARQPPERLPSIFDPTVQPTIPPPGSTPLKGLPSAKALQNVRRIISMTDQTYLGGKLEFMLQDVFDVMSTPEELQFCIDRWQRTMRDAGLNDMADSYMWQVRSALSD
ncbi:MULTISPECIES: hypothetical protein [Chitinibacter]|jgi:hypothetical protein|uniref:hypothetical protein n=1 Tax=Chitinibacter TaxID=230666 RepID=UPI000409F090|nr:MULTISPECIES: hypothetical protein [Chitinibacter]